MSRVSVFRSKFFWKIYTTFSLLFLISTFVVSWIVFVRVQSSVKSQIEESLYGKVIFLLPHARQVFKGQGQAQGDAQELVMSLGTATNTRVTLIDANGQVVADSSEVPDTLANHLDRDEIREALRRPLGSAERRSDSTHVKTLYLAKAVQDGDSILGFVRVALPTQSVDEELKALWGTIAAVSIGGVIVALIIGWTLARKVMLPISEMVGVAESMRHGKYEAKVRNLTNDELGRLGDTLNRLGTEMTHKISELQRLENVRRDFVANVSHEIKTPLTSIKGYVETLLSGAIDHPEHRIRFLEKIDRNAERLTSLVQDILSLAKIEAGEDSFKPTPIEWNPLITSIISRHEDAIQKKNLKLRVNAPASPVVVMGDKEAMIQVLDNLLTNAIKYTTEGGKMTVSLMTKGPWGKVEVEDTGIGIPAEHLDRIFERFYRIDKARSRELGGTGLGLSIVKHLVSAMGGEVGVESSVGVGSKFTVRLKLAT